MDTLLPTRRTARWLGLTLLTLAAVTPLRAAPAPMAEPMYVGARLVGTCEWTAMTSQVGNPDSIHVQVGDGVKFGIVGPFYQVTPKTWTFEGQAAPADLETLPGTAQPVRAWTAPGIYTVGCIDGMSPPVEVIVVVSPASLISVKARITADNSYRFGTGSAAGMTVAASVSNTSAAQIFGCASGSETYMTSAPSNGYIYLVTWSDDSVTQGVLGSFSAAGNPFAGTLDTMVSGAPVFTGDDAWSVYATGLDFDGLPGPSIALINQQIALANAGAGPEDTSSVGWVGPSVLRCDDSPVMFGALAVGEANNQAAADGSCDNAFQPACQISAKARWMWYDTGSGACPFTTSAANTEFLIFRLPVSSLPPAWERSVMSLGYAWVF